jgi:hypothetical protein
MARDNYSDAPTSAPRYHASTPCEHPQRRHSSLRLKRSPTTATSTTPTPAHRITRRQKNAGPSSPSSTSHYWQTTLFRAIAPAILFSILIAGLLVELRTRLAATSLSLPAAAPPPGLTVLVIHADTALQRALIWAECHWPGLWVLPVLCVAALGALRAAIWVVATVFHHFVERVDASRVARVRVGRWEDGGSVSGGELLAEMFT